MANTGPRPPGIDAAPEGTLANRAVYNLVHVHFRLKTRFTLCAVDSLTLTHGDATPPHTGWHSHHPALPSPLALRDPGQHHGHSPFRQRNHQSKALKSKKTGHQTDHKKDAHVRRELRRGGAWPRLSPAPVGRLGGREGATHIDLGVTKTLGTTGVCVYLCALSLLARFLSRSLHLVSLYRWAWAT